jgi:hypothetical protein
MATVVDRLEALEEAAQDRGLTPVAWWIGQAHHDEVREALSQAEGVAVETEGHRLTSIDGREVKVLDESPHRFALWCEEGALDL